MKKLRTPRSCPINFEFSVDNIECKVCKYFDSCLVMYMKAKRLSENLISKRNIRKRDALA